MISLGMLSAYSAYSGNLSTVYDSPQVSSIKNKQDFSDAENLSTDASSKNEINDEAIISDEAKALFEIDKTVDPEQPQETNQTKSKSEPPEKLSPEQQQVVAELKARDAEVRAHEQAHIAAAAGLRTSAPSFDYQEGPDGKKYAIGGEVSISFTKGGNPEEDIQNAETMKAAALAPVEPSGQDLSVARNADEIIQEARQRLAEQKEQELKAKENNDSSDSVELANSDSTQNNENKSVA